MSLAILGLILFSTMVNAVAQFALRHAMLSIGPLPSSLSLSQSLPFAVSVVLNPFFMLGIGCYLTSMFSWMVVLSRLEVSLAYPFASLGFVFAALIGFYFFGENVSAIRILGIALICTGLVFLVRSS